MKPLRLALAAGFAAAMSVSAAMAADITGAGATFPYPIYAKWADAYKKETGVGLNYQSIGSGGGIKQIHGQDRHLRRHRRSLEPEELDKIRSRSMADGHGRHRSGRSMLQA